MFSVTSFEKPNLAKGNDVELKQPRGSAAIKLYQREIQSALETVAALEPDAGCCVSETALVIRATNGLELKTTRDTYRTAFELMADRGIVRREHNHWRFRRSFRAGDVPALVAWRGIWKSEQNAFAEAR